MTPKDKAKDLINKMDVIHYMKLGGINSNSKGLPVSMHDDQVKQCALIAVDEVLKAAFYAKDEVYNFYIEVKIELENYDVKR